MLIKARSYFVGRQHDTYTGGEYVEISIGNNGMGLEYSNPGLYSQRFGKVGEYTHTNDPREAVEDAIAVRDAWRADILKGNRHVAHVRRYAKQIHIYKGCTGGSTCFFDEVEDHMGDAELRAWAEAEWATLPKCDQCGDLLPDEYYYLEDPDWGKYCSSQCCDRAQAAQERERYLSEVHIYAHKRDPNSSNYNQERYFCDYYLEGTYDDSKAHSVEYLRKQMGNGVHVRFVQYQMLMYEGE